MLVREAGDVKSPQTFGRKLKHERDRDACVTHLHTCHAQVTLISFHHVGGQAQESFTPSSLLLTMSVAWRAVLAAARGQARACSPSSRTLHHLSSPWTPPSANLVPIVIEQTVSCLAFFGYLQLKHPTSCM